MEKLNAPALPWAAGVVLGAAVTSTVDTAPAAWLALAVCAACLMPRWGLSRGPAPVRLEAAGFVVARFLVAVGLTALIGEYRPGDEALHELDAERPVTASATVIDAPRVDDRGHLRGSMRITWVEQGEKRHRARALAYFRVSADGAESVGRGATLEVRGYLKRLAPLRNLRELRPGPWRFSIPSSRFLEIRSPPPPWARGLNKARSSVERVLDTWSDPEAAALVRTLWLGDRSRMPERWQRALRAWGLAHLTAVSGLHVGAVALFLWAAGAFMGRRKRLILVLVGIAFYAALLGPRPSVMRAAAMAWVALMALIAEKPPVALNALAVAVLLLIDPAMVVDLGFQLSVAATAGLLLWTLPIARVMTGKEKPPALALALATSLAAQLAVLPFAAPAFALVHPASPWIQLVAALWLFACLAAGAVGLTASALGSGLDGGLFMQPLTASLEILSDLPIGPWAAWPISIGTNAALAFSGLGLILLWRRRAAAALLLTVGIAFFAVGPPSIPASEVEVVAIDVGQGDALLLRSAGASILVDGGGWRRGDSAARQLIPTLADLGVRRLDAVVLSHPDGDHCDGLRDLASYVPIAEVWTAAGWSPSCAGELVGRRGLKTRFLWRGRRLEMGEWRFETLWPRAQDRLGDGNDRSLVMKAEALGRSLLLTGDIGSVTERVLLAEDLRSDIVKIAHHGSKSSSHGPFLDAAAPKIALIQAGRSNFYGHPHPSVLQRLEAKRIAIWRSDRHGLIQLRWTRAGPIRAVVSAGSP